VSGRARYDRQNVGLVQPWLDVSVRTFICAGTAAEQTILAINNPALSGRIVTLRRLLGRMQVSAQNARPVTLLKAPALATDGTVLAKTEDRTSQAVTTLVALGANASEGGGATAITNPAGLVRVFSGCTAGGVAVAGAFWYFDIDGIDQSIEPGESFCVTVDLEAAGNHSCTAYLTEKFGLG